MVNPVPGVSVSTAYKQRGRYWSLDQAGDPLKASRKGNNGRAGWGIHTGDDYAAKAGTAIVAATPGVVIAANAYDSAYGYKVIIRWDNKYDVWYCHMPRGKNRVKVGQSVKAGDRIGEVGSTGNVSGPHLHLELRVKGGGFSLSSLRDPNAAHSYKAPQYLTAIWGDPKTWKIGSTGEAVTRLGQRIEAHFKALGLASPYKTGPGPTFTETDRKAVERFQKLQGWSGKDADGYPGAETFKRLAAAPPVKDPFTQSATVMLVNAASRNPDVNKKYGSWSSRVQKLAAHVLQNRPDILLAVELYEAQRDQFDRLVLGTEINTYARIGVMGGRVIYIRRGAAQVMGPQQSTDLRPGAGTKYAVGRKIRFDQAPRAVLNASLAHLSYETNAAGVKKRAVEAPAWVKWTREMFAKDYDLLAGDVNSPYKATTRPDDVGPIMKARGLHDLGDDAKAAAGKGKYHLLRAFAGQVEATKITTKVVDYTDHSTVLMTIAVPGPEKK